MRAGCRGLRYAECGATPGGSASMRKRKCGFTSTALSAISIPASKSPSARALRYSSIGLFEVRVGNRPPVGPAHEGGEDVLGARVLVGCALRLANEDPAAAGRVPVSLREQIGPVIETWKSAGVMRGCRCML